MKRHLVFLIALIMSSQATMASEYDEFQSNAKKHGEQLETEGLSYMIGGSLGLTSSLVLGITSEEVLPKTGYILIQTLSSAAVAYGGILYFTGDDLIKESERLRDFSTLLTKTPGIHPEQRKKLLDEATGLAIYKAIERKKKTKRIKGILELVTAAASTATLVFSESGGTASNITLGFMILISTAGGISDLFAASYTDRRDVFTTSATFVPGYTLLAFNFNW